MVNDDGVTVLPDGSAFATASLPLPKDHWIYEECGEPPMPWRIGVSEERDAKARQITEAVRYAVRASTMSGKESDFDPDAMVQNVIVGLLGYWTLTGNQESRAIPSSDQDAGGVQQLLQKLVELTERQTVAVERLSDVVCNNLDTHGYGLAVHLVEGR